MRDFWRTHRWPAGERRLHWLIVFDQPEVYECYLAHRPVLEQHGQLVDIVPFEWLHLTIQSLCPMTAVSDDEVRELVTAIRDQLSGLAVPQAQLGPARIDGGAVTWAVYPAADLSRIHAAVQLASIDVLGGTRVANRRNHWSPHVTLGYGAVDDPADDDLAAALAFTALPRAELSFTQVVLVDMEQDFARRQYRWERLSTVHIGSNR